MARAGSPRWLSAVFVLAGTALLAVSCLNPRPDDMPSVFDQDPSGRPSLPGSVQAPGENPGIGGDNLVEDPEDGNTPIDMGPTTPPSGDGTDPNRPDDGSTPDAGRASDMSLPAPDAGIGADGG